MVLGRLRGAACRAVSCGQADPLRRAGLWNHALSTDMAAVLSAVREGTGPAWKSCGYNRFCPDAGADCGTFSLAAPTGAPGGGGRRITDMNVSAILLPPIHLPHFKNSLRQGPTQISSEVMRKIGDGLCGSNIQRSFVQTIRQRELLTFPVRILNCDIPFQSPMGPAQSRLDNRGITYR